MKKHFMKAMLPILFGAAIILTGCPNPGEGEWTFTEPDETMSAMLVSNCTGAISDMPLGLTSSGSTGVATKLSADKLADMGGRFRAIRIDVGPEATNCEVFIAQGDIENVIYKASFTPAEYGWKYIDIPEADRVIYGANEAQEDYFIGATFDVEAGTQPIKMQYASRTYSTEYIYLNGTWNTTSSQGLGGRFSIQAVIDGGDYSGVTERLYGAAIEGTAKSLYKEGDANTVKVAVYNVGVRKIQGAKIAVTAGSSTSSFDITDELLPGQSAVADVPVPTVSAGSYRTAYDLNLTVTPNGDGSNFSRDDEFETTQSVFIADGLPRNAALIEQFTSQACVNCPDGAEALQAAIDGMSDPSKAIWVAHHAGYEDDIFTLDQSKTLNYFLANSPYGSGAPAMDLNRMTTNYGLVFHPVYTTTSMLEEAVSIPTVVSLDLSINYVEAERKLDVTVTGESRYSGNLKMNVLVCQDGMEAQQTGSSGLYVHNHAPRIFMTEALGSDLTVNEDGTYTWQGSTEIPETIGTVEAVDDNMYVVAYVSIDSDDLSNVDILNVAKSSSLTAPSVGGLSPMPKYVQPENQEIGFIAPQYCRMTEE